MTFLKIKFETLEDLIGTINGINIQCKFDDTIPQFDIVLRDNKLVLTNDTGLEEYENWDVDEIYDKK